MATVNAVTKPAQIRLARRSPAYWRVTIDNPPINVMGPEMVRQFQEVINALEADEHVRVVVFDSAVDDYFLNHSDFMAKLEDLTSMPSGPTGLPPWPDFLVRLTRLPVAPIALSHFAFWIGGVVRWEDVPVLVPHGKVGRQRAPQRLASVVATREHAELVRGDAESLERAR